MRPIQTNINKHVSTYWDISENHTTYESPNGASLSACVSLSNTGARLFGAGTIVIACATYIYIYIEREREEKN